IFDLFLQRQSPPLIVLDAVAGHACIEQLAHGFDHRIRHGDVHIAPAPVEFDVEAGHHDDLGRADDVGEVGIDLGVHIFDIEPCDVRPRLLEAGKHVLEQHVNHTGFGRGEFATLDFGEAAVAAEEVVDDGEHELRIQHDQASTAQRQHLYQVE